MVLRIEDISFIGVYINDSFRDFKDINDYDNKCNSKWKWE